MIGEEIGNGAAPPHGNSRRAGEVVFGDLVSLHFVVTADEQRRLAADHAHHSAAIPVMCHSYTLDFPLHLYVNAALENGADIGVGWISTRCEKVEDYWMRYPATKGSVEEG